VTGCHNFIHEVGSFDSHDFLEGDRLAMKVVETRIKWASLLIGAGLLVQLLALLRVHPLAFVAFLALGCPLVGAGIVLYLLTLLPGKE
jgi:hypothetical protein